jgi:hypothetical protein
MAAAGHYPHTVQKYVTFDNSPRSSIELKNYWHISKVTVTCFLELARVDMPMPNFINVIVGGESFGIIEINGSHGRSQPFNYGSSNYAMFDVGLSDVQLQDISKDKRPVAVTGSLIVQLEIEHSK